MTKQTHFKTAKAMAEGNKSLSYGVVAVVRAGFRRLGLYEFLDTLRGGTPFSYIIELLCIDHLNGNSSMNCCANRVIAKSYVTNYAMVTRYPERPWRGHYLSLPCIWKRY